MSCPLVGGGATGGWGHGGHPILPVHFMDTFLVLGSTLYTACISACGSSTLWLFPSPYVTYSISDRKWSRTIICPEGSEMLKGEHQEWSHLTLLSQAAEGQGCTSKGWIEPWRENVFTTQGSTCVYTYSKCLHTHHPTRQI